MEPPASATSPVEAVLDHGMGDHCGHCLVCDAYGDEVPEDAAWLWVVEHECGVETPRHATVG